MIRRVSSRPRLVSDADRAFQNATVEDSDFSDGDGYSFGNGLDFDDDGPRPVNGDGDSGLCFGGGGLGRSGGGAHRVHGEKGPADLRQLPQNAVMAMAADGPAKAEAAFSFSDEPSTPVAVIASDGSSSTLSGDNPPTASATAMDCDRFHRLADQAKPSSSSSLEDDNDNDLSQFLSCYDLVELQDSFQKQASLPSETERAPRDRESPAAVHQEPIPTTALATPSAKRKRPSQHYVSPKSSLASVPQPFERPTLYPSLLDLPAEDNLVCIASYLSHREVRLLASTCKSVRETLAVGVGAATGIWMRAIREKFPGVFSRIDGVKKVPDAASESLDEVCIWSEVSYQDARFVDDYRLPTPGLSNGKLHDDGGVNLPLLAGLLPARYPCSIDAATLRPFRSYALPVDLKTGTALSRPSGDDGPRSPAAAALVPVVQFTGRVNRGNRCVRSDAPFPSSCDCAVGTGEASSPGSTGFGGLSSWVKGRAPRRRWSQKGRGSFRHGTSRSGSELGSGVDPRAGLAAAAAYGYLAPTPLGGPVAAAFSAAAIAHYAASSAPGSPRPMRRFLSSLNRDDDDDDDSAHSSLCLDGRGGSQGEDLAEDGGGGGGATRHGLFDTCRGCLGKLQRHGRRRSLEPSEGLRPFVVPTVVADHRKNGGKLEVDVTPRLVAYFEVTIVKQGAAEASPGDTTPVDGNDRMDEAERRRRTAAAFIRLAPFARGAPLPLPREARFLHEGEPRRWAFPDGRDRGARRPPGIDGDDVNGARRFFYDPDGTRREAFPDLGGNDDDDRRRADPPRRGQRHRHACVAVGLSAAAFRPRDKMPGWDEDSFGYHGDDGGLFHGRGDMLRSYGPPYGPGDTVGCGLDYASGRAFFVKNGRFLGWAFGEDEGLGRLMEKEGGLYPTVGVDTECPLFVNYGEFPFAFNLRGFARAVAEGRDVDDDSAW